MHLPIGTAAELDNGEVYIITGEPIGYGGGSILYPARRQVMQYGVLQQDEIHFVLKECYPASVGCSLFRNDDGAIVPCDGSSDDMRYLHRAQLMQMQEGSVSQRIYRTASRMIPIRSSSQTVSLTLPGRTAAVVPNTMTVMDSLAEKGRSLTVWMREKKRFTPAEAFRMIQQLLFALQEVHQAGYLHLDIQDGNVFLRGVLEDKNELVTLIDFGCAREMIDGKTAPIQDKVIFTTQGFSAPEILLHNDGNLQLGPEADIFSVGCLILYLLTGLRANVRELIENRTGIYLRSNQLRRIKCPKHLVDSLQHILAMSLAREPENRYHSVDAMLEDVTALAEALQPYRTDLSSVKYDAFICYKHGPIDSVAALTLQRALENYHAPKGISDKKKPFGRVFVDEGELSSCGDFGQQIREALKNSGWLIVICSPDTPLSPWVQLEIDTFLEYHDRSRILAVLTGGSPDTSFPPQLKGVSSGAGEVFAAHAISNTPGAAAKKLKGDALLKVAAPMLGTTYDTLKQRHKLYRLQKTAAITAGFLVAAVGFAAYAVNRANVIAEQAVKIEEEYQRALINESLFLAEQAQKQLDSNDPLGAIELALQALPSADQNRPVLTEAEYVLGKALGIYTTPGSSRNTVTAVGKIETGRDRFVLDESGDYMFVWNSMEGGIQVWETKTMKMIHDLYPDDPYSLRFVGSHGDKLYLQQVNGLRCINYLTGEEIWFAEKADTVAAQILENSGCMFAFARNRDGLSIERLAMDDGSIQKKLDILIPENLHIQQEICISEDGMWAVVAAYDNTDQFYVLRLDLTTGACHQLLESTAAVQALQLTGDTLAVIRSDGFGGMSNVGKSTVLVAEKADVFFDIYGLDTCSLQSSYTFRAFSKEDGICEIKPVTYQYGNTAAEGLVFIWCDRCILLNRYTGEVVREYTMPSSIVDVQLLENGLETVNRDGSIAAVRFDADTGEGEESVMLKQYWTDSVTGVSRRDDTFYIQHNPFDISSDYTIRKYKENEYDDAYKAIWSSEESGWRVFECAELDGISCAIMVRDDQICVADTEGNTRIHTIPEEYGFSIYADMHRVESVLYWNKGDANYALNLLSGEAGEVHDRIPEENGILSAQTESGAYSARHDGGNVIVQDRNGSVIQSIPADGNLAGIKFTPDENSLLLYSQDNVITRYSAEGKIQGSVDLKKLNTLSLFSAEAGRLKWEYLDEETLLVITGYEGFLLDIAGGNIKILATIDHCIGYDPEKDSFITADMETNPRQMGLLPRYSLDELIQKGNAVLGR